MTYKDLLEDLKQLPPERLNDPIRVYDYDSNSLVHVDGVETDNVINIANIDVGAYVLVTRGDMQ